MSTFDFSTLYTKIPHHKLLHVSNEITDFTFKGGTRDFGHDPKVKLEDLTLSKK